MEKSLRTGSFICSQRVLIIKSSIPEVGCLNASKPCREVDVVSMYPNGGNGPREEDFGSHSALNVRGLMYDTI